MEISNWVLKKYITELKFLDFSILDIIKREGLTVSNYKTLIDWEKIENKFSFFYDFIGNEEEIKKRLYSSLIFKSQKLIIDIGIGYKPFEISTQLFIQNWEDFVASNGYCGIFIISLEHHLFMEFTDDENYELLSNFYV
ncbi:hypothetical protein B0A78_10100 [Flavobacterium columnare NBRC 100251 = ATCC 23463]|uniref:hypothetical protein n=1 Tax=Flavobacterium columnare TaxID=996 RepID=UPI000BEA150B|nr:hypothetical protein [Flavobacterium columnare]PDS23167.1 hypothetical protein B0A78_10100 [Flavobacterium columnare NBRC 100251 = ATCC 23463]GEM59186.1 hypothetical protein FC1_24240 [Flavobacterium columnare NBRC 100251 = ATCC 23463]